MDTHVYEKYIISLNLCFKFTSLQKKKTLKNNFIVFYNYSHVLCIVLINMFQFVHVQCQKMCFFVWSEVQTTVSWKLRQQMTSKVLRIQYKLKIDIERATRALHNYSRKRPFSAKRTVTKNMKNFFSFYIKDINGPFSIKAQLNRYCTQESMRQEFH